MTGGGIFGKGGHFRLPKLVPRTDFGCWTYFREINNYFAIFCHNQFWRTTFGGDRFKCDWSNQRLYQICIRLTHWYGALTQCMHMYECIVISQPYTVHAYIHVR